MPRRFYIPVVYAYPEIVLNDNTGSLSDMWTLAIVLYTLLERNDPSNDEPRSRASSLIICF